jgi:hypothetical protein
MVSHKNGLAALALGHVVMASASPGFAQERTDHISAARAAALRECNALASKHNEYTWGDTEIDEDRACMARHHQAE